MINKLYIQIFVILALIVFQSCDDEWIFDIPGCMDKNATNYDLNAMSDNGSCYYGTEIMIVEIDASSYNDWVYFSLGNSELLNIEDAENSMEWDLAFKRNNIKTNGGLSGIGSTCSIVDDSQSWTYEAFESTNQIPENDCEFDEIIEGDIFTYEGCYNPITHLFSDCVKNPALDKWGSFDSSYNFNVNNFRFFVKLSDGSYVKLWLMSYYNSNGQGGKISLAYHLLQSS